jgi:N-acetylglucosaminyldiphosphoundecaprenol N-acetyl-beta-D-mannosaminyltransferase
MFDELNAATAQRDTIFGFRLSAASADEVVRNLLVSPRQRGVGLVVTPNADHVVMLRQNIEFARAYGFAEVVLCDGFPVQYYARVRGIRVPRVTGNDLVASVLRGPFPEWHRPFFLVDSDTTARAVYGWWAQHGTAGAIAIEIPPFGLLDDPTAALELAGRIRAHAATLLVMCIGAPRSEIFVHQHRDVLPACWAICVGQALRMQLGLTRRAPRLARQLHVEWLWRVCQEPRRLARRYARDAILFPLAAAADMRVQRARSRGA